MTQASLDNSFGQRTTVSAWSIFQRLSVQTPGFSDTPSPKGLVLCLFPLTPYPYQSAWQAGSHLVQFILVLGLFLAHHQSPGGSEDAGG